MLDPQKYLHFLEENNLKRTRKIIPKSCMNFSSNDYLNLSQDPSVKKNLKKAIDTYGFGSTGSPLTSGYTRAQERLEKSFAEFLQRDKAIFFNSGYHANCGVIPALIKRHSHVLADKLIHASLLDGLSLSRARMTRYPHQNFSEFLNTNKFKHNFDWLVTESIFSMEGDLTDLSRISQLAKITQTALYIDDAHGLGILGQTGAGVAEHFGLSQKDLACLVSPLGKAFGGMGAIVSGSEDLIEFIVQTARTYKYSTALPPALAEGLLTVLTIIKQESWRREKLQELIFYFLEKSKSLGLKLISEDLTPIKSILIGENLEALKIQDQLLNQHIFVSAIRPPTVPIHTARLRISLSVAHEFSQIDQLLNLIASQITQDQAS